MIRNLLASTAIATLVATGSAFAQATAPAPATDTMAVEQQVQHTVHADGHLASNIIGEAVYNGAHDEADNIGNVNDIILADDGSVEGIIIGVGGFLGLGQKEVAVEYNAVQWAERDGDRYLVLETTREQLEALPDFDLAAYEPQPADAEIGNTDIATADQLGITVAGGTAAAATTQPVEGDDVAAAPADTMEADEDMAAAPADGVTEPQDDVASAPAAGAGTAEDTMATTDQTTTAAIDRGTLTDVDSTTLSADEFIGTTVYGANDENVGSIGDIILGEDGSAEAVIIDVGGFLGLGTKEVAVGMDNLAFLTDEDGNYYLYTEFTQEQLEAQPEYDEATYAEQRDQQLLRVN